MGIITKHPLFPAEADENPTEVEFIQVFRGDGIGRGEVVSKLLRAEELSTEEQVFQLYGPGVYELVARSQNRITRRRTIRSPGMGDATGKPSVSMSATPPPPAIDSTTLLTMFVQSMQAQQAQTIQMMQMVMTLSESKSSSLTAFLVESQKSQMMFMTELMKAGGAAKTSDPKEILGVFEKGVAFLKDNMPKGGGAKSTPIAENVDSMANLLLGLVEAKKNGLLDAFVKGAETSSAPTKTPAPPQAQTRQLPQKNTDAMSARAPRSDVKTPERQNVETENRQSVQTSQRQNVEAEKRHDVTAPQAPPPAQAAAPLPPTAAPVAVASPPSAPPPLTPTASVIRVPSLRVAPQVAAE